MQGARQLGTALLTSILSLALVIGGLSLALSENAGPRPNAADSDFPDDLTATALAQIPGTIVTITPTPASPTSPPTSSGAITLAPFTPTNSVSTPATIATLSGNCGPPPGWVKTYVVRPGDTLFRIAVNYSTTTAALQLANCKGSSTNISTGEILWVPNVAPLTPGVTNVPTFPSSTSVPTDPLTETSLPFTGTPSPTQTQVPATHTPLPTVTPVTPAGA